MNDWTQDLIPITSSCFDECHELVWIGNEKGYLTSYYGSGLQRYTSARAYEAPICSILSNERGIISLSNQKIRLMNRRGLFKWTLDNLNMDLQCMTFISRASSNILVGGLQPSMLTINIERGSVVDKLHCKEDTVVMKHGRYICCGSSKGGLSLLDPSDYKEMHFIQAHSGTFSDLDIQGNLILTCGFSQRDAHYVIDPLVKVFDIRTLRPLVPVAFPAGPTYIKMHPKMSTTAFIVSQTGLFHVVDTVNTVNIQLRHASSNTYFTSICVSQSGDALILCDAEGILQLWSQKPAPKFSEFSIPLEWPNIPTNIPDIQIHEDTPLNVIGMPYYREELFSSWPAHLVYDVGKIPCVLNPDIISNMKTLEFVGYSMYTENMRRNQTRYYARNKDTGTRGLIAPKFHSEKAKELTLGNVKKDPAPLHFEDENDDLNEPSAIPKYYKLLEIKYSKFGVEDFDFGYYNNTPFSGLEIHIQNSYCNSLVQLYYFIHSIRQLAIAHSISSCIKEDCLLCEMGFLFKMLFDANGQNCQATNFLHVLSTSSQAMSLGLIVDESMEKKISFSPIIQGLNRFLLEKLNEESLNESLSDQHNTNNISPLAEPNGIFSKIITFCSCGVNSIRNSIIFSIDFIYPKITSEKSFSLASFSSILAASINREKQNKAWCSNCHQFRFLTTRRTISSFPCYLNINAMAHTQEHWKYWSSKNWLPTKIALNHHLGKVICFQGKDINKKTNNEFYIYQLKGLVVEICFKNESHLVSFIHMTDENIKLKYKTSWFLFNDFLVMSVSEDQVLNFSKAWKVPAILIYEKVDYSESLIRMKLPSLDISILYKDYSISLNRNIQTIRHRILEGTEKIDHNTVIGLDAEFVSMQKEEIDVRSDGTRFIIRPSKLSLARVSAVRGNGELENVPFIDDYIAVNEPIVDYLTEFSGIKHGDLDPMISKYTLVPLKIAYKKLRLLVTLGCKFVGHGLQKDFRIINIHVPKDQVIDTVNLFYLESRQRKLSLRFLAWYLLQDYIQQDSHDSIEDARTALLLYKKYENFKKEGIFEEKLKEIYDLVY
ncbi:hypothetical protein MERGE_000589 [Pneumocystis wakefieldiae]|uniref:PAN2-PAN3 deadenylation complex catalytic subunit PAN2 n=1 Tax=Pneumocystis wakefieldiae TaxID=38082 RepID=A0A899G0Y8_9ASCO|nr:hypothetical protein MERGE_000589 [Pneumocystis wakefieldiae]